HLLTGSFAPIGAALFGFLYAPLVITGVHQTTLAIDMQMIQSMRGTPSVNRQLRADRRRAVRLPLRAAGDYRCPPDHPRQASA
ncbi:hypothetical protein, partial [Klebsiella pneumoniae]|uniref:hypothetical protein n=1 Tax=Klebsiella pneumoniae TaxID=573 RepID=UPI001AA0CA31